MQLSKVETKENGPCAPGGPLIEGDARLFQENFNRASFQFAHNLAGHPLFELPRLLELAKSLPGPDVYFDSGDIRVNQRWDETPRSELSIAEVIDRIENAGAWVLVRATHKDPSYAALIHQALEDAQGLVGAAFPKWIKCIRGQLFVTSPNRITTYHMDRECNFLLQLRGDKTISLFDRYDRVVTPEEEIERFWTFDSNAAVFKEQYRERARAFDLRPGVGVHIPVNSPHWVKNGNNVSVTWAVTFQFHDSCLANIYKANYRLRQVGLKPLPPGQSKVRDTLKAWTVGGVRGLRSTIRRVLGRKELGDPELGQCK